MSEKIILFKGGISVDDRGSLHFVNDFHFEGVKRFYQVENHRRGFVRAWHGHQREGKYVWVANGSALIGVAPINAAHGDVSCCEKFVLSEKSSSILWIPPQHFNGFMSLAEHTKVIFYSTLTMEEAKDDDIRLPYDTWNLWEEHFR